MRIIKNSDCYRKIAMSDDHFHVHAPHDHVLEGAGHHEDVFSGRIAVMTAILSTIGALLSYQSGATQNQAMMYKNDASILKTEASDKWNFYQAKSNKQNLAELAMIVAPSSKSIFYSDEIKRYKAEKEVVKKEAEYFEKKVKESEELSDGAMHIHHRWAQAMTIIQISISLSAITLLTRRKWLAWVSCGMAALGLIISLVAVCS
jgi:Domain of unknown function (DUF4337)